MANTRHSDEEMQKGNMWVGSSKATREPVVIGERYPPSQPETRQDRAQLDRGAVSSKSLCGARKSAAQPEGRSQRAVTSVCLGLPSRQAAAQGGFSALCLWLLDSH